MSSVPDVLPSPACTVVLLFGVVDGTGVGVGLGVGVERGGGVVGNGAGVVGSGAGVVDCGAGVSIGDAFGVGVAGGGPFGLLDVEGSGGLDVPPPPPPQEARTQTKIIVAAVAANRASRITLIVGGQRIGSQVRLSALGGAKSKRRVGLWTRIFVPPPGVQ